MSTLDTAERRELSALRAEVQAMRAEVLRLAARLATVEAAKPDALTMQELGFTVEDAAQIRSELSACLPDWDAPEMDSYNKHAELFH